MVIELPSLYPHQEKMRDDARAALVRDRRAVLCAPPGTGKTRTAKWILGSFANRPQGDGESGRALFVVHRRGLVDNASHSFAEEPILPHGVIMSQRKTALAETVQVASIDTLNAWYCDGGNYTGDTFDLVIFDECVSGDSMIDTDVGRIKIDEVPELKPSKVRSYSKDKGIHFARILNWKHSGYRSTLEVHTHIGKIQCTPDHKIYTRRGWLEARFVLDTDEILVCAAADRSRVMGTCSGGGTGSERRDSNLKTAFSGSMGSHHCVPAVAVHRRDVCSEALTHGWSSGVCHSFASMRMVMKTAPATNCWSLRHLSDRRFLGRCSVTRQLTIRTNGRRLRESAAIMVSCRRAGLNTRPHSFTGSTPQRVSLKTEGGATVRFARQRHAIRHSVRFTGSSHAAGRNTSRVSGWTLSGTSVLHGGCATTVQQVRKHCNFIRRDSHWSRMNLLLTGSATTLEKQQSSTAERRVCHSSTLPVGLKSRSVAEYRHTSHSVCVTNWSRVTKIVPASQVDVYDIEVEKSHCFFANNLLVHNCHSHVSTLRSFLGPHDAKRAAHGLKPAYVLGLSATPQHKELHHVFKAIIKGPSPQWLIDNKFLSPFRYFRATQGKKGLLVKRGDEYTEDSVAAAMEGLSGDMIRDWIRLAKGRSTVGFFPRRSHAAEAVEAFRNAGVNAMYLDGETPDDERLAMFDALNTGRIDYIANVGVIERGTDIPRIGCVQMCVFVGSIVRWLQMIGRGSRVHPDVADCIVLDHGDGVQKGWFFEDDVQWSLEWGERPAKTHNAAATIECPQCGLTYRGGKCKCGYEPTRQERRSQGLEFTGGELREIKRSDAPKPAAKSNEQLMIQALYVAGKRALTFGQAWYIASEAAKRQGTQFLVPYVVEVAGKKYKIIPHGHSDAKRRVRDTYGFTIGDYSAEGNPYRIR